MLESVLVYLSPFGEKNFAKPNNSFLSGLVLYDRVSWLTFQTGFGRENNDDRDGKGGGSGAL